MIEVGQQPNAIRLTELDGQRYFLSLMEEGVRTGQLKPADRESLLTGCRSVLIRKTGTPPHGRADLQSDTAQALLESIFYTVGVELKIYRTAEDAIRALETRPIEDLYIAGQLKIREKYRAAHLLQRHIKKALFPTENRCYGETLKKKLDGFFHVYRPASFAQLIHVSVDYPALLPVEGLTGVEFIETYLRRIALENRFCNYFDPAAVDALLERIDPDYRDGVMNICRPVLYTALGCVLTERPYAALDGTPAQVEDYLEQAGPERREELLSDALDRLTQQLDLHPDIRAYLRQGICLL